MTSIFSGNFKISDRSRERVISCLTSLALLAASRHDVMGSEGKGRICKRFSLNSKMQFAISMTHSFPVREALVHGHTESHVFLQPAYALICVLCCCHVH